MRMLTLSLALPFLVEAAESLPSKTTVKLDKDTNLVLFGARHGNRNPEQLVDSPSKHWGQEGSLELTSVGKRQSYGLGKEMRHFLGKYVDENYVPSEGKFYTSSANRCQMTLQTILTGIYDPSKWAEWDRRGHDHWSPVPYTIDDPMLRMYSVDGCLASDEAWEPISKDTLPQLVKLVEDSQPLLQYMKEQDGRDATISNAADIADNILNMDFYKAKYPKWLAQPTLSGYNASSIRAAYLTFAENHMNECAAYEPCRTMMGGLWGDHIVKSVEAAIAGTSKTKLIGYASHTEVTLSVMKVIGIDRAELTTSAGFVIEARKNGADGQVRIHEHDPNPIDKHVIYPAHLVAELSAKADKDGWMSITDFKAYVSLSSFSNWQCECKMDSCVP